MAKQLITAILSSNDYFSILGVSREASNKEIKCAYRRIAVQVHPDKCKLASGGVRFAEEAFKKVSGAYVCLSDPKSRARYERGRERRDDSDFTFGDAFGLFASLFGDAMRSHQSEHTPASHAPTLLPVLEMKTQRQLNNYSNALTKRERQCMASIATKLAIGKKRGDNFFDATEATNRDEKLALLDIFDKVVSTQAHRDSKGIKSSHSNQRKHHCTSTTRKHTSSRLTLPRLRI